MAVFEGFAVSPFAFFGSGGFLTDDEVCCGCFFPPLTDSPVGDEYDNDGNDDCDCFFHIFFRMKLWESRGNRQIYVVKCWKLFLFFIIIALFLFF